MTTTNLPSKSRHFLPLLLSPYCKEKYFSVFKKTSMLGDKISLPLSPFFIHIFTAVTTLVIHENCQNDSGSAGWAGTAATKHSYYPSFMIFPSCFPPSFFSSIVSVLKLPFCSSFVSSPPLHAPILMLLICFPSVHPDEFSTTPSVLGRREEEFRVAMATTSWLQAICSLISTGREWWTYILNLIFFTLKKKKILFGWTKLLVNWSLHNQPESLFVCVGHQHFLVAVFRKNIMSIHKTEHRFCIDSQWQHRLLWLYKKQDCTGNSGISLNYETLLKSPEGATGLESNMNTWLISHWFINASVWQLDGKTYI